MSPHPSPFFFLLFFSLFFSPRLQVPVGLDPLTLYHIREKHKDFLFRTSDQGMGLIKADKEITDILTKEPLRICRAR